MNRRELLQRAGAVAVAATLEGFNPKRGFASAGAGWGEVSGAAAGLPASWEWIRRTRLLIGEGYTPPFFPALDYEPEKAVAMARQLGCDSFRYPSFSYVAFFPTETKLPRHPELGSRDPFRRTAELCHNEGLKLVAYNPLNHPFMDVRSDNKNYQDWARRYADGRPMITTHYGWARYYEGCLNSPVRDQIRERVREVVTNYDVDMMYFDGPYQGMDERLHYCHCPYCRDAYKKARGRSIPMQDETTTLEDTIEYEQWLAEDVVDAYLQEIADMVHQVRDVPVTYNNGEMLINGWASRAYQDRGVSAFMFEAARTPEQKLFNMRAGQSTGKVMWTYVGSHTEYNREHIQDKSVRGWYSYPVEGERQLLDAAVATATGVGYCYWGLNRLFYLQGNILEHPDVRNIRDIFALSRKQEPLLRSLRPAPQAGILIGTQTIGWYRGADFVPDAYDNYFYGAFQVLKDLGYDSEPFLDYRMSAESLAKYQLVYVPNAPCLSEAQCAALTSYVEGGGTLVATHLTSVTDEYGRPRKDYRLSTLFGATLNSAEPVEMPELYLRLLPSQQLIPQDPQVVRFTASPEATVLAETWDRGYRLNRGAAILRRRHGKGQAIYIGSGLEAVYAETLNADLRAYFHTLLDPILAPSRRYEVEYRPGLMPEFAASEDALVLHLLADTGNICKKPLVQEEFLPIDDVRVRLRLPEKRTVKSVALLWSGATAPWKAENGWVEVTVPRVRVYEAVRVELNSQS